MKIINEIIAYMMKHKRNVENEGHAIVVMDLMMEKVLNSPNGDNFVLHNVISLLVK